MKVSRYSIIQNVFSVLEMGADSLFMVPKEVKIILQHLFSVLLLNLYYLCYSKVTHPVLHIPLYFRYLSCH